MSKPYRPANGSEGTDFVESFCDRCAKDANSDCPILASALAHGIDEPGYPREWISDESGPRCTAFQEDRAVIVEGKEPSSGK